MSVEEGGKGRKGKGKREKGERRKAKGDGAGQLVP